MIAIPRPYLRVAWREMRAALLTGMLVVVAACASPAGTATNTKNVSATTIARDRYVAPAMRDGGGCHAQNGLPDTACTPGATDPRVTQANIDTTICRAGYTKTVRPPEHVTAAIKRERMDAYGAGDAPSSYELDHLIPLELGGAPAAVANLWPEPLNGGDGAHTKDQVENALHRRVCAHVLSLAVAQREIATDWRTVPTR
jgi:hypothetical protein